MISEQVKTLGGDCHLWWQPKAVALECAWPDLEFPTGGQARGSAAGGQGDRRLLGQRPEGDVPGRGAALRAGVRQQRLRGGRVRGALLHTHSCSLCSLPHLGVGGGSHRAGVSCFHAKLPLYTNPPTPNSVTVIPFGSENGLSTLVVPRCPSWR